MTHHSDDRYRNKPDLTAHYFAHGVIVALFAVSPLLAWGFDFHPFSQSLHGYLMWLGMVIVACLAFGPASNAARQNNTRFINLYRRILSPLLLAVPTLALVALWVFAFHESYAGSVFIG